MILGLFDDFMQKRTISTTNRHFLYQPRLSFLTAFWDAFFFVLRLAFFSFLCYNGCTT